MVILNKWGKASLRKVVNHSDNANRGKKYKTSVSLNGHLFDQFLINEALDIIGAAGGSFHLARCELGQTSDAMSYTEIEISANDKDLLAHIVDFLAAVANSDNERGNWGMEKEIKESSVRNRVSIHYEWKRILKRNLQFLFVVLNLYTPAKQYRKQEQRIQNSKIDNSKNVNSWKT